MSKITIYTTKYCPYCLKAKALLQEKGFAFEEVDVDGKDDRFWDDLCSRSGMYTVPQIFAGDRLIGGCDQLAEQNRKDGLASLRT